MKPKTRYIYCAIYRTPIILRVGGSKCEAEKLFLERMGVNECDSCSEKDPDGNVMNYLGMKGVCIYLKNFGLDRKWIGVLAHECMHASFVILTSSGVSWPVESNEEAYTYHFQWLMSECLRCLGVK